MRARRLEKWPRSTDLRGHGPRAEGQILSGHVRTFVEGELERRRAIEHACRVEEGRRGSHVQGIGRVGAFAGSRDVLSHPQSGGEQVELVEELA